MITEKEWLENLQSEVVKEEFFESYFYEVTEQHSSSKWFGLKGVIFKESTLDNGKKYYVIAEESCEEIVKMSRPKEEIIWSLLNQYEPGEFGNYQIFENAGEAYEHLESNYPQKDLEKIIKEILLF